jgi:hypothetical protein
MRTRLQDAKRFAENPGPILDIVEGQARIRKIEAPVRKIQFFHVHGKKLAFRMARLRYFDQFFGDVYSHGSLRSQAFEIPDVLAASGSETQNPFPFYLGNQRVHGRFFVVGMVRRMLRIPHVRSVIRSVLIVPGNGFWVCGHGKWGYGSMDRLLRPLQNDRGNILHPTRLFYRNGASLSIIRVSVWNPSITK